jgi:hypothetical protein
MSKKRVSNSYKSKKKRKSHKSRSIIGDFVKKYKEMSISFKLLVGYMLLIASTYLLFVFYPTSMFLGKIFSNDIASVLNLTLFVIVCAAAYGILMKYYWAWQLAITWFVFEILNSFVSLRFIGDNVFSSYLVAGSYYLIAIDLVILWFLYKKKDRFTTRKITYRKEDRAFVFSFLILVIVMLLLVSSFFARLYVQTSALSRKIISEINHKSYDQAIFVCEDKELVERDMCYVVVAVAFEEFERELCDLVNFEFYKATCVRAAQ